MGRPGTRHRRCPRWLWTPASFRPRPWPRRRTHIGPRKRDPPPDVGLTGRRRRKQTRRNKRGYTTTWRARFGTWRFFFGMPRAVWERACPRFHWYGTSGSFDRPRGLKFPKLLRPFRPNPMRSDDRPLALPRRFVLTAAIAFDLLSCALVSFLHPQRALPGQGTTDPRVELAKSLDTVAGVSSDTRRKVGIGWIPGKCAVSHPA